MKFLQTRFICALLLTLLMAANLNAAPTKPRSNDVYQVNLQRIPELTRDLYETLDAENRARLTAIPFAAGKFNPTAVAQLSESTLLLINQFAHAKAVDRVRPGFFQKYLVKLAKEPNSPRNVNLDLPDSVAWSLETVNRQMSLFNQIAGSLLAIDMAHQYLGHYERHGCKQISCVAEAVNSQEWRNATLRGAGNAMECALGVEGLQVFIQAFGTLEPRPKWVSALVPSGIDTKEITRALQRSEDEYFSPVQSAVSDLKEERTKSLN